MPSKNIQSDENRRDMSSYSYSYYSPSYYSYYSPSYYSYYSYYSYSPSYYSYYDYYSYYYYDSYSYSYSYKTSSVGWAVGVFAIALPIILFFAIFITCLCCRIRRCGCFRNRYLGPSGLQQPVIVHHEEVHS